MVTTSTSGTSLVLGLAHIHFEPLSIAGFPIEQEEKVVYSIVPAHIVEDEVRLGPAECAVSRVRD